MIILQLASSLNFKIFKTILGFDEFVDFVKKDWQKTYVLIFLFLVLAISINYHYDLEDSYLDLHENTLQGVLLFFVLNLSMYGIPLLLMLKNEYVSSAVKNIYFWVYLLLSLLYLSAYQSLNISNLFFADWYYEDYFNRKIGARINSLTKYIFCFLFLGVLIGKGRLKCFGFLDFKIKYKTYFGFLLVMLPLIIFASTQQEFLETYPKLKQVNVSFNAYLKQLAFFEPLYLADFIMLEWFFRGFMVLFFARYINKKAIILVAMVYCSFHFGKPLLECIGSFFGGYLLGYVVFKTKSIWGGVIVHMGIAFMMDLFAFISKAFLF